MIAQIVINSRCVTLSIIENFAEDTNGGSYYDII